LPDLSSVSLVARLDESDRGSIRTGQPAVVRADAVPDRDYSALVSEISLLARTDFTGTWPPSKLFDLTITIDESDGRLRPGMSVEARIDVGRIPDVLMAPSEAVFAVDGQMRIYVQRGAGFVAAPVTVRRQGREFTVVEGDVREGDRIALTRPDLEEGGTQ
jgi:HlyD family secretion protein